MKLQLFFWLLIFIFGMGPNLEAGEIYQWIDKDGVQHFTNLPPPPGAQIVEGLSETQPDEPPANTGPAERKDTRAVEGNGNEPVAPENAGAVKGSENGSTNREEYWRRKGWGNESTDRGDDSAEAGDEIDPTKRRETSAAEGGENAPPDGEDNGAVERREDGLTDREEYWRRKGWGNESTDRGDASAEAGDEIDPTKRKIDLTPND